MPIYDCQHHWWPRDYFDLLLDRKAYPKTVRSGDGYTYWFGEGRGVPFPIEFVDLDLQFEQMAATGFDLVPVSAIGGGVDDLPIAESLLAARIINDARARAQSEHEGAFYGIATLPWLDTDLAMEELDRAIGTLGLRGVTLPANINGEGVESRRLHPMYARIAQLGVPIFIHPTRSIVADRLTDYECVLDYMLGWMMDTSVAAMRLVLSGIVARHPDLRILHHHAGATIPYLIGRIDKEMTDPWSPLEPLPELPSWYLRRMYADCVALNPATIRMALEFYEEDHVVFGSDYPFWPVDASMNALNQAADGLTTQRVLTNNALTLLGVQ
jgi:aminocarboxymuconate-semialdehyde decarboxylase